MDLSKEAKEIYDAIKGEYGIDDEAGLLLLQTAMESFDEMRKAQNAMEPGGFTKDRFGQRKQDPAATNARAARTQMLSALKQLNLDIEPLKDGPGRPLKSLIQN